MDIPVPEKKTEEGEKISVNVASSAATPEVKPSEAPKPVVDQLKAPDATSAITERSKQIADLVSSKKYVLDIKEKRSTPVITMGFSKSKDKKTKKNQRKANQPKAKPTKTPESRKAKSIKLALIFILWAAAYVALDLGLIDIGWRPPFSIFRKSNGQAASVLQQTGGGN